MDAGGIAYRNFLNGDQQGFEDLVRLYRVDLTRYLNSIVSDFSLAEDLTEDTFFRLLVKKPHYADRCSFKSWLYAIGRNLAIDALRRIKRHPVASEEMSEQLPDRGETPEDSYLKNEEYAALYRAMQALNPDYRTALYLLYFEGFDMEQTAAALGKRKHQTETLVWRAKEALRAQMEKEGYSR